MARFEITGKKPDCGPATVAAPHRARPPPSIGLTRAAFSINEFCAMHGISRATFYNLQKRGQGPDVIYAGAKVLITVEAAARWRKNSRASIAMQQYPTNTIPAAASLRRRHRRLAKHQGEAARILTAMRECGDVLHLHYRNGRALWSLQSGPFVTAEAAAIVTASPDVVSDRDTLLADLPGQSWRHT